MLRRILPVAVSKRKNTSIRNTTGKLASISVMDEVCVYL